jgi:glycosyltransferase involved in cell wall biosynthesis
MSEARHIYCYPFTDVGNSYINKNIELWRSMGYHVSACPGGVLRDWRVPRARKTIILNWYEDWMLRSRRRPLLSLLWAALLLGLFALSASNLIWVRHNHHPHDTFARSRARRILVFLLGKAASSVITHRAVPGIDSRVIPHPLVIDPAHAATAARDIEFLWFGMVREYKGLENLLRLWPGRKPLLMFGKSADPALSARLRGVIAGRGLAHVAWHDRFIPDDELNQLLRRARFVVLAHDDQTIIVSGAFYHAIACGANVIVRDSDFGRHAAGLHSYAHLVDLADLEAGLAGLGYVASAYIQEDAARLYGDGACRAAWAGVL